MKKRFRDMGTNFYIRGYRGNDDPEFHIGKRSAAGQYCWGCKITLCKEGEARVHYTSDWYDSCPICGKKPDKESLKISSAGRELGFNKKDPQEKKGVASCSSFSWAMQRSLLESKIDKLNRCCSTCNKEWDNSDFVIENEYGDLFTLTQFEAILKECPIQYTNHVGQCFF